MQKVQCKTHCTGLFCIAMLLTHIAVLGQDGYGEFGEQCLYCLGYTLQVAELCIAVFKNSGY